MYPVMTDKDIAELFEAVRVPLILIGQDQRISHANKTAERVFDRGLVGRHHVVALRHPGLLDAVEAALKSGLPQEGTYEPGGTTGRPSYEIRAVPIGPEDGRRVVVSLEDLSGQREADSMRRDFVANVSHELRTPLTAVLGFIETIEGAARDDPQARDRFLQLMRAEAERMNRLVQDLLSLSRVEASERQRPAEPIDPLALLEAAVMRLRATEQESGVSVSIVRNDALPAIPGDADQLTQVFSNLLENAVKYGARPGDVRVIVSLVKTGSPLRGAAVRIDVQDEGEGIGAEHIARLTERFYRVDTHRSREMGGTGLGLAIVKHIVNRHRGLLRVSSEQGKGSTFSVFLPVE